MAVNRLEHIRTLLHRLESFRVHVGRLDCVDLGNSNALAFGDLHRRGHEWTNLRLEGKLPPTNLFKLVLVGLLLSQSSRRN